MKIKKYSIIAFALVLTIALCIGGSKQNIPEKTFSTKWELSQGVEPVYVTEWPENIFTVQIIEPEYGEMDYVLDNSDSQHFAIFLKNITNQESEDYVEKLKKRGYSETLFGGNHVSVGMVLQKDNVLLNVTYSGTGLGILITIGSDTENGAG